MSTLEQREAEPASATSIATAGIALAFLGAAWLVDPFAEAAFDAPKRLGVLFGVAIAALALCAQASIPLQRTWSPLARIAALGGALLFAWWTLAAVVSPHPDVAWLAWRRSAGFALLVPLGAARALGGRNDRRLFVVFALAVASNAALSLLQWLGLRLPLNVAQLGGRFDTGALLGNEGYVSIACALLGAACVALLGARLSRRLYWTVALVGLLAIATIAFNRQATSALAFVVGSAVVVCVRWGRRRMAAAIFLAIALLAASVLVAPVRSATWAQLPVGGVEGYQRLTTYRLGAWLAALDMTATRPWTGYGPGTYAAEQQTHRFAAEISLHERFVQPFGNSFLQAHDGYLQLAAEAGVPALLFALAALAALFGGLIRLAHAPQDAERDVLLALLGTGAVAALAWFPMQIPLTAAVLLFAAGRAWRLVADDSPP